MRNYARLASVLATGLLFLVAAATLWGQAASTGTLIGVVTDQTSAVVPEATVTITDSATHETRTTTTNAQGRYLFQNVPPGNYDVAVKKSGFALTRAAGQTVSVGTQTTVNLQMRIGEAREVIEVQASNTDLQTLSATVGNTVTGIALRSLPSLNLDVSTFATLQPGVSPDGSVAGTVVDNSSFQLDGGNNTSDMDGSMSVYLPAFAGDTTGGMALGSQPNGVMPTPADSVEEFKVNTANQTADFNSSSGMQVQVVTKRGTNTFHGTAYEYYFDNNFNANTWINNAQTDENGNWKPTPNPSFHRSRFGVAAGGPILPNLLGGKTYIFGNYQGFRWPNSVTYERTVPSAAMRLGLLTFGGTTYNLNPFPVSYGGTTYPGTTLDPRAIGINSYVQQLWTKYMPAANDLNCSFSTRCDGGNVQGFRGNMALPQRDNFFVTRLDHDFGSNWHFMSSYRYYKLTRAASTQVDIGGMLPGNTLGVPASAQNRPQVPWFYVAGLTTNISPTLTNDFHYNFLRNYWSWSGAEDKPQFSELGGALEIFGESASAALVPYNLNTQNVRTRFWDGQDHMFRDDLTWLRGNHLFQFGGTYQHNYNFHQRSDNGGGINYQPVYQLGSTHGAEIGGIPVPSDYTGSTTTWGRDYVAILGIVSIAQTAYTRSGNDLHLNPPNTHAFDQSTIPYYNFYASDTWHMKKSLTVTYGLGWTLEMPPTERYGKQIVVVDQNNKPLDTMAYLKAREDAALKGEVYNPIIGFSLLPNVAGHPKYLYDPYYKEFSPRVAVAWNPHTSGDGILGKLFGTDSTVVRGGYGRIFGRLNGVDLVLAPLLGTGLIQPVQCFGPTIGGACGGSNTDPTTAFRIGTDGNVAPLGPAPSTTLVQPDFPGVNAEAAGAGEGMDPHFRPNVTDTFTFSIQRQLGPKISFELGYIGRRITHEYQPININAVPYMMTKGGQTFAKAYANIEGALGCAQSVANCGANVPSMYLDKAKTQPNPAYGAYLNSIAAQPFFQAALNDSYCQGTFSNGSGTYGSCTAAVLDNELGNFTTQSVWSLYSDLDNGNFNFSRSMLNTPLNNAPCPGSTSTDPCGINGQLTSGVGMNATVGHGNYHGAYFTLKTNNWHGLTTQQNFTWSKALGTGATVQATSEYTVDDPFNLDLMYGVQNWDRKFVYNFYLVYDEPFYRSQKGLGRLLGGWRFAPVFTAGSGEPMALYPTNSGGGWWGGQAFGEGDSNNFFSNDAGIIVGSLGQATGSLHYKVAGSGGVGTSGYGLNYFKDPAAAWAHVRDPILGLDTFRNGGFGQLRGFPYWNLDLAISKNVRLAERFSLDLQAVFSNVLNHFQPADPNGYFTTTGNLDLTSPDTFGTIGDQINNPRQMEFSIRVNW